MVKGLRARKPLRRNENFRLLSLHVFLQNSSKIADDLNDAWSRVNTFAARHRRRTYP